MGLNLPELTPAGRHLLSALAVAALGLAAWARLIWPLVRGLVPRGRH